MTTIPEQVIERLNARPPEEKKRTGELGQQDFLALMIAQVQNQDPFQPMENGEFIAQMAQFATVDGIQTMQASISDLNRTMASNQALMASALVGRSVLAPGSQLTLGAEGVASGVISADPGAASLVMDVFNATGALVARREFAPSPTGSTRFAFDGIGADGTRLPPGSYRVQVGAVTAGKASPAEVSFARRIDSVTIGAGIDDMKLNLDSGDPIGFSGVREFL